MLPTEDVSGSTGSQPPGSRWLLVRHVLILQLKLGLDGLRDFLLLPISLVCLLADLLIPGNKPGRYTTRLMALGRRSDRWINLFGEHGQDAHTDLYVRRVEDAVVREYRRRRAESDHDKPSDKSFE